MINGKTIVLTGASSGIGLEVLKLLKEGPDNRILAVSRHAVEKLTGFAENVTPFDCDMSSPEGIEKLFDKAESMFGKIDIFYANAGFPYYERYDYTDWERVERMFRTNTFAPMYTYSRYIRHLNGREGHLAITVSAIGQMAMPGYAIYSASKFAVQGFQQFRRYRPYAVVNHFPLPVQHDGLRQGRAAAEDPLHGIAFAVRGAGH